MFPHCAGRKNTKPFSENILVVLKCCLFLVKFTIMTGTSQVPPLLSTLVISDKPAIIAMMEHDLKNAEAEVLRLKTSIKLIKRLGNRSSITELEVRAVNLKWRKEIRRCLNGANRLMNSVAIAECIRIVNKLPGLDRNITTKISTTLSLMYSSGEIGRIQGEGEREFYYGLKEYFEENRGALKSKHKKMMKQNNGSTAYAMSE